MEIKRRTVLGGLGLAAMACAAGGLGMNHLIKRRDESYQDQLNKMELSHDQEIAALSTQINQAVEEAYRKNITPSPIATVIVNATTPASLEMANTLTAVPTSTTEAIATPTISEVREKLVGKIEVNPWDGGWSIPANPSAFTIPMWYALIDQQTANGNLKHGDIRTFDRIKELSNDISMFTYPSLSEGVRIKGGSLGDEVRSWVPTYLSSELGYNVLPKAYEAPTVVMENAMDLLTNLGHENPTLDEIDILSKQMLVKMFDHSGNGDQTKLYTSNTYPTKASDRSSQRESTICSVYSPDVKIGEEYVKGGLLYLSNKADVMFEFVIDQVEEINVENPEWLAVVPVKDKNGNNFYWKARMFDFGSRPNPEKVFGFGGIPDPDGSPWGSQILPHCGFVPAAVATNTPAPTEKESHNTEIPKTEVPQSTITEGPRSTPTLPVTEQPTPTEAPTNVHTFPTATDGPAPTNEPIATDIP